MPQVTVYIREADLAKWKAIKKKSEFLHQALAQLETKKTKYGRKV